MTKDTYQVAMEAERKRTGENIKRDARSGAGDEARKGSGAESPGIEPSWPRGRTRLATGLCTLHSLSWKRKVKESNPQALAWPGFRDRLRTIPRHPPTGARINAP